MAKKMVRVDADWLALMADLIRIHSQRAGRELMTGVADDNPQFKDRPISSLLGIADALEKEARKEK